MPGSYSNFFDKVPLKFAEFEQEDTTDVAGDRPGLLSDVGRVFVELGINIDAAKIMTIGERAEDVFYVSDGSGNPLNEESRTALRESLLDQLDTKA